MKKAVMALILIGFGCSVQIAVADVVSHYTFNDTAVNSVVGTPDGTVMGGASYVAGEFGNALNFSSGQYVDTTTAGQPVGNNLLTGSIALWIKTTSTGIQKLMCAANSTNDQAMDFNTTTDGLEFYLRGMNADGWKALKANATFSSSALDGQWHHVAVTWLATTGNSGTGTCSMYLDGVSQSVSISENYIDSSESAGAWENPMRIAIGGRDNPTWDPYSGGIDEVWVCNSELTADQVHSLYTTNEVPEPATACLLVLGGFAAVARRRRHS